MLGLARRGVLTSVGDMYADPFTEPWPGFDPAHIGYVFTLTLRPGQTAALVTFVVKGLSEVYDPRGGFPIPLRGRAGRAGATPSTPAPTPKIPAAGIGDRARDRRSRAGSSPRPTCAA